MANPVQQQLGHSNVEQTMRYARFHPDYGDVEEYFGRVEESLAGTESQIQNRSDVTGTASDACGR